MKLNSLKSVIKLIVDSRKIIHFLIFFALTIKCRWNLENFKTFRNKHFFIKEMNY